MVHIPQDYTRIPTSPDGDLNDLRFEDQLPIKKADNADVDVEEKTKPEDIKKLISEDPALQELYQQFVENSKEKPSAEKFHIHLLLQALMDLGRAFNFASAVESNSLNIYSQMLNATATLQKQIPIITKDKGLFPGASEENERNARADLNQQFGNMSEAIRANRGMIEDKAKKVQTMLQTVKDAAASSSDFLSTLIDLIRNIKSKIAR